ncbi:uncharacterized protein [Miscanthus floridulus]|uniref:uncharacterized protein n=1 Tax=Miscanthus floridulus TaxID=154761 RepID=UPI0034594E1C
MRFDKEKEINQRVHGGESRSDMEAELESVEPMEMGDDTSSSEDEEDRTETLTFDVVGFPGTFHDILRHPCYAKFMAIPNYTYLKLKMPGPHGVITVGTSFRRAYECEVECYGHATVVVTSKELTTLREEVVEAPDAKRSSGSFESVEGFKEVLMDPSSSEGKKVCIRTTLSSE